MTTLTINDPVPGQADVTEEQKIPVAFDAIKLWANGNIDEVNFKPVFLRSLLQAVSVPGTQPKWNLGTHTLTGPNASNAHYSNQDTIPHGLGVIPQLVIPHAYNADVRASVVGTPDATNFQIMGSYNGAGTWPPSWPVGATVTAVWIAIGW